ncbi:hypothetical protein ACFLUA_01605 [Chloroflexota bacterium]
MFAKSRYISPIVNIRRERTLPIPGKILVRRGQRINAMDTIAEAILSPKHRMLNLARGLGVSIGEVGQHLQCGEGMHFLKGDIIAGPVGRSRRVVRAPESGQVIQIAMGKILFEIETNPFQLKAGLSGNVVKIISNRGAVVETTGALIQGVWGNELIGSGNLVIRVDMPDEVLSVDKLDTSLRGSIVAGGSCEDEEVLKTAESLPLRGMIFASMRPGLIPTAVEIKVPVILTDGYENCPMNTAAFELLTSNNGHTICINAQAWDHYKGTRPEIVIPKLHLEGKASTDVIMSFCPNQTVRVTRAPSSGQIGRLINLIGYAVMPSGVRTQAAEVLMENDLVNVIPLANLEILE